MAGVDLHRGAELLDAADEEARAIFNAGFIRHVPTLLEGQTICASSDAAAWPVQGLMRDFRGDFEAHIREAKCPFPESFKL